MIHLDLAAKAAAANDCAGTSLFSRLPAKFEPSDLAFDATTQTLFIVSDNGQLGALTDVGADAGSGAPAQVSILGSQFDLEGSTLVPSRPGFIYLGNEFPATIVEFNLNLSAVSRSWEVQSTLDAQPPSDQFSAKNEGMESLVFFPTSSSASGGFFYVGRQADAQVFVFDIDLTDAGNSSAPTFVGTLTPPGPGNDLSSMTIYRGLIWFLYDKPEQSLTLSLASATVSSKSDDVDASKLQDKGVGTLSFPTRGQEGLAFAEENDGSKWVFVGVDPPKGKGNKDLVRYDLDTFFKCFSSNGAPPARKTVSLIRRAVPLLLPLFRWAAL
ncbi:hypothetical protein HKX48_004507 [Thoreauomyces humboldtii]|nr:hypothetical protein HKX48_004507 [Thoreauomyces humboldtii]